MNLWLAGCIIAGATAAAVTVMARLRRRAPVGGYFADSDRAAGVLSLVGTSFAVVLAFVIFLAFESYGSAKREAGQEAIAVIQLYDTSSTFSPPAREELRGQVLCYARSVIHDEWTTMRSQRQSRLTQRWADSLTAAVDRLDVAGEKQSVAYDHLLSDNAARAEARRGRLSEAASVVPLPLWLFVVLGGLLAVGYMCFYADSGERFVVQALMMGSVTAIVTASLLVVHFLDHPYDKGSGSIKPGEMASSLVLMEQSRRLSGPIAEPCDAAGRAA